MKNKHLKFGLLGALSVVVIVQAEEMPRMFMRVVLKNEIIVDATSENARAIVDAAKRDCKKMCQKYSQAMGVVGASTEAYDETIRRCESCMGLDMAEEDMPSCERCGCKPRPKNMETECYGMDRCGCKPRPKTTQEAADRCGCKPRPKSCEMSTERCGCNKPKPKTTDSESTDRCSECGKPEPKAGEMGMMDRCGCNKPRPRSMCASEANCVAEDRSCCKPNCGCNSCSKPCCKSEVTDTDRCGCNKPKPKSGEATERCGCNKPKPRTTENVERMGNCGCSTVERSNGCNRTCNAELCNCNN